MRGLMGSLNVMPLQEVIDFLDRRAITGTLTCERGAVRKTCHLVEGVVVEASSNDPREYLGQLLVNFGHVDEGQLAGAFQSQVDTKTRLGKVLVQDGLLSAEIVRDVAAVKIRETLLDAFLWESGFFYVEEMAPRPSDELDAHVPLSEIAREAEFRVNAWRAFRAAFPDGGTTLDVDATAIPKGLDPASANGRIVLLARQGKTIDEIAVALHATDFHLYQRLYALWTQGVLRPATDRSGSGAGPEEVAALVDAARLHLQSGRLDEAELSAVRALALDPEAQGAAELRDRARELLGSDLRSKLLDPPRTPALQIQRQDIPRLGVSSADKWLLARCDGTRDTAALVKLAPAEELDVLRALKRLAVQRLVALR